MSEPTTGVVFRPQSPPEQLRNAARRADEAGIDELWLWEDCFLEGGLTAAAAALAWTGRLTVGVGLLPVPLRNPALVAMELATLARLFPGRFLPALGHGVQDWMAQVGGRVASPMALLREHTDAVRTLLAGRTVTATGKYVRLDGVTLDWPPQQPQPVLIGGRGPKTLRLAGEVADGVLLDSGLTLEQVRESLAAVEEGRAAAGRTDEPFRVVGYVEVDPAAPDLPDLLARRTAEFGAAGVTSVVFQTTDDDPDPEPLIAALGRA